MKRLTCFIALFLASLALHAQPLQPIKLNLPDLSRGLNVMKALSLRASASEYDTVDLKLQDLSDLLWAANGINRPENGKRTAPSAMNAQDIDVFVVMKAGIFLYDAKKASLEPVVAGDYRKLVADRQENFAKAPVICLLVSDISRFKVGDDAGKLTWAAEDAGIVSQNIGLFCAAAGMITRPRATMNQVKLHEIMKLKESQHLILNNPVSYQKK
jgi:hypothetical protein